MTFMVLGVGYIRSWCHHLKIKEEDVTKIMKAKKKYTKSYSPWGHHPSLWATPAPAYLWTPYLRYHTVFIVHVTSSQVLSYCHWYINLYFSFLARFFYLNSFRILKLQGTTQITLLPHEFLCHYFSMAISSCSPYDTFPPRVSTRVLAWVT